MINEKINVVKNECLSKILDMKHGEKYDVAVMYSGGKDSSFLLVLLKYIYKKRVIAITIDNGYEKSEQWEMVNEFPKKLNIDHVIVKPDDIGYKGFIKSVVIENELYKREGTNHICFMCNNFLWLLVSKYALDNNIPYVASGLSLEQLSSGRKEPLKSDDISNTIAAKSTHFLASNAIKNLKMSHEYEVNEDLRRFVENISIKNISTTTIYPFIYHELSVEKMKQFITEFGWVPPRKVSIDDYISSGCKIMSIIIPELEKLKMVVINEREQNKRMIEKGLIDKKYAKYSNEVNDDSIIRLDNKLFEELEIKDYLIRLCKEKNRKYEE